MDSLIDRLARGQTQAALCVEPEINAMSIVGFVTATGSVFEVIQQDLNPCSLRSRRRTAWWEVRFLYTRPNRLGMGAGTQLIDAAKASGTSALELWCFQPNVRARRFYEARGFQAIRFTDGADNEERMPVVRYRWER